MLSTSGPRVTSTRTGLVMALGNNRSHAPLSSCPDALASQSGSTKRVPDRREATHRAGATGGLTMRGYFAVGTDGLSKPMNLRNLLLIAQPFRAPSFFPPAPLLPLPHPIYP